MFKRSKIFPILLAAAFALALSGIAQQAGETAKDPVCGMSVKIADAKFTFDYNGAKYYFCSESCKTEFSKNPEKYLGKEGVAKPAAGGMQMHHRQMKAGEQGAGGMKHCQMMMKDVEKKIENTKDGVMITLTSKNAETVKKLQEHAAMMKEGKCPMMGKCGSACMTGKDKEGCAKGKDCPTKKK